MSNAVEVEPNYWRSTRMGFVWISRLISYIVYFYILAAELILGLGFFLLLTGANRSSGFADWAYRNLERVMRPFRGIFEPIEIGTTNNDVSAVFDTSVLFAMVAYAVLGLLARAVIRGLTNRFNALDREKRNEELGRTADQMAYAARVAAVEAMKVPTWEPTQLPPTP
jgi:hypothetical protein